jgi:septum formation protein
MNEQPSIILASGSPRRTELLKQIDFDFQVIPSTVHEDFDIELDPIDFVKHYAKLKAIDVAKSNQNSMVIGADTIVVLDGEIIGKPKDRGMSKSILTKLSGRTHQVITGIALIWLQKDIEDIFHVITDVTFQQISDDQIQYYIENYNPLDKAGSYGIQDWFAVLVNKINGCYYNVMGFPLSKFYEHYSKIIRS